MHKKIDYMINHLQQMYDNHDLSAQVDSGDLNENKVIQQLADIIADQQSGADESLDHEEIKISIELTDPDKDIGDEFEMPQIEM